MYQYVNVHAQIPYCNKFRVFQPQEAAPCNSKYSLKEGLTLKENKNLCSPRSDVQQWLLLMPNTLFQREISKGISIPYFKL